MPEIGQSGSEGGAKIAFVPTPILLEVIDGLHAATLLSKIIVSWTG